jgi:hypothetical protein
LRVRLATACFSQILCHIAFSIRQIHPSLLGSLVQIASWWLMQKNQHIKKHTNKNAKKEAKGEG